MAKVAYSITCPLSKEVVGTFEVEDGRPPVPRSCPGPHLPTARPGESVEDYLLRAIVPGGSIFARHNGIITIKNSQNNDQS